VDATRSDVQALKVPTVELAREVGSERAINMVMIGALCAKTGLLSPAETIKGWRYLSRVKRSSFLSIPRALTEGLLL